MFAGSGSGVPPGQRHEESALLLCGGRRSGPGPLALTLTLGGSQGGPGLLWLRLRPSGVQQSEIRLRSAAVFESVYSEPELAVLLDPNQNRPQVLVLLRRSKESF